MTIEKLLFELNASSLLTKDAVTKRPLNSLELNFKGQSGVNRVKYIEKLCKLGQIGIIFLQKSQKF